MKSTYFFPQQLLRLKELLKAKEDQDVATALGMTKAAFSARKARGSFPETELYALAARQPELGIDVPYVLTGITQGATARLAALQHTIETASAAGLSVEQVRAAAGAATGPSAQRIQALDRGEQGARARAREVAAGRTAARSRPAAAAWRCRGSAADGLPATSARPGSAASSATARAPAP